MQEKDFTGKSLLTVHLKINYKKSCLESCPLDKTSELNKLLAWQENLLVSDNQTGLFSSTKLVFLVYYQQMTSRCATIHFKWQLWYKAGKIGPIPWSPAAFTPGYISWCGGPPTTEAGSDWLPAGRRNINDLRFKVESSLDHCPNCNILVQSHHCITNKIIHQTKEVQVHNYCESC